MNPEEIKSLFTRVKVWTRGDQRAPHKPLLLLLMLARLHQSGQSGSRLVKYEEIRQSLYNLLLEFGPPRSIYHPQYPFLRLANDSDGQLWTLEASQNLNPSHDYSEGKMTKYQVSGGFSPEVYAQLKSSPELTFKLAESILHQNFPESIHSDILSAVGFPDYDSIVPATSTDRHSSRTSRSRPRDPRFRERILRAYEYSCAVCGFNVRLGSALVAIEAAHIKWHQAGGPDIEQNGIALCSMHHKLFDRGVFSLNQSRILQVSQQAHGSTGFEEWLLRYHGQPVRQPQSPLYNPANNFIAWHISEVFRDLPRYQPPEA